MHLRNLAAGFPGAKRPVPVGVLYILRVVVSGDGMMKYFVKISIEGSFPSGVDELGTYQISEKIYHKISTMIERGFVSGEAKRI